MDDLIVKALHFRLSDRPEGIVADVLPFLQVANGSFLSLFLPSDVGSADGVLGLVD